MSDSQPTPMTIDIYSDVMCPWCAIGYGQLTKALGELDGEIEAEIRWRPFELNPDMPEEGEEQEAHLQRKYRRSAEEGAAVRSQMKDIAEGAGVSLTYEGEGGAPLAMMWNTRDAHKLLSWALEQAGPKVQTELKLALFRAHFNQRLNVSDAQVLPRYCCKCRPSPRSSQVSAGGHRSGSARGGRRATGMGPQHLRRSGNDRERQIHDPRRAGSRNLRQCASQSRHEIARSCIRMSATGVLD